MFRQQVVVELRSASARYPEDPVGRGTSSTSTGTAASTFARLWGRHEHPALSSADQDVQPTPTIGAVTVDCDVLHLAEQDQTLVLYSAPNGRRQRTRCGSWADQRGGGLTEQVGRALRGRPASGSRTVVGAPRTMHQDGPVLVSIVYMSRSVTPFDDDALAEDAPEVRGLRQNEALGVSGCSWRRAGRFMQLTRRAGVEPSSTASRRSPATAGTTR